MSPVRAVSGLLLLAGIMATACGVPVDGSPREISLETEAANLTVSTSPAAPPPSPASPISEANLPTRVILYFDREQSSNTLVAIARDVFPSPTPENILELLLTGPTSSEIQDGYRTHLPPSDQVLGTEVKGSVFEIDFTYETALKALSNRQIYLAMGQLALTLIESTDVESISILIDGELQEVPTDRGNVLRAVEAEDYSELAAFSFPVDSLNDLFSGPSLIETGPDESDLETNLLPGGDSVPVAPPPFPLDDLSDFLNSNFGSQGSDN